MTRLNFHAKELSDLFALKTFYDYLKLNDSPFEIEFSGYTTSSWAEQVLGNLLKDVPLNNERRDDKFKLDNLVTPYSDIGGKSVGLRNLEIDVSILKNCVLPKTEAEKQELRIKHNVRSDRPVLVIGYASGTENEYKLVHACKNHATIIFAGGLDGRKFFKAFPELEGSPHILGVKAYGILREIYAVADVAVNSHNFVDTKEEIHNFIEATEGGPLFMVPSSESHQYGYSELAKIGAIKKCRHADQIIDGVKRYLIGWSGRDPVMSLRAEHLISSRKKYLPVLEEYLKHYFLGEPAPKHEDIIEYKIDSIEGRTAIRLSHKLTSWDCPRLHLQTEKTQSKFSRAFDCAVDAVGAAIDTALDYVLDAADYVNENFLDKIAAKKGNPNEQVLVEGLEELYYELPNAENTALLDFEYNKMQN